MLIGYIYNITLYIYIKWDLYLGYNGIYPMSSNMACWNIHHRERCPSEEKTSMANSGIFQLAMFDYRRVYGYGSIPINTIFRGMNIHLPAISMFTRGTRF